MKDNRERFIQDMLDTFDDTNAYQVSLFLSVFFGVVGLFYAITTLPSILPYIYIYDTYFAFLGLSVFCIIGGIGCLYVLYGHYISTKHHSVHERIHYLPVAFLSIIPGFIMIMYSALVTAASFTFPISIISFYLCFYAIIVFIVAYFMVQKRINSEKEVYQKKTLRYVQWVTILLLVIAFLFILFLRGSVFEDLVKIALITIIVSFFAYQAARTLLASRLMKKMDIDMIDYQNLYHDGRLGEVDLSQKARVYIINDGRIDKALNILVEFGFDRDDCMRAIIKHQPFYTFDEKMYYDLQFMNKLLMRLAYEDVPFQVEVLKNKDWEIDESYQLIEKHRVVRKKKADAKENDDEVKEKNSWLFNIVMSIIVGIGMILYGLWSAFFPVNYFKPVRWCSSEQIQTYYNEFTYRSTRTLYHLICIWIIFLVWLFVKPIQIWVSGIMEESIQTIWIAFGIIFVGELFVFPMYLKKLKAILQQEHNVHNYEKRAFLLFILYSFIRSLIKGWQKSLCMLIFLIVSIELAKSIYIFIRYIQHRKEVKIVKQNEEYEIVEEYDMQPIIDRLKEFKEDVIVLEYSDLPVNRYCSKLGGLPYLLEGENIPCDGNEPLILLAQINFDELKGKTVGDLPDHGMLQFFIKCDDVYGCDFDFNVDNPKYRVVYHEKVDYIAPLRQDVEYINEESPLHGEYRLNLSIQQVEGLSVSDFQFIDRLKKLCDDLLPKDFENNDGFMDALYEYVEFNENNQMLGQGSFAQEDSRGSESMLILLQLLSDETHMMWGDYGTCHFLIDKDDLKNKRFDQVIYTWDCY